jgi:high-affinity iron transporter
MLAAAVSYGWAGEASTVRVQVDWGLPPDRAVSPAVVYLEGRQARLNPSAQPVLIDQKGMRFIPRVAVLELGGLLIFRNSDPEVHNVNSSSRCCSFNLMVAVGQEVSVKPERPGIMTVLCNIHPQMRASVVVIPGPYWAWVEPGQTEVRLERVPAGSYRVVLFQEQCRSVSTTVEVPDTEETTVKLELIPLVSLSGPLASAEASSPLMPTTWTEVLRRVDETLEQSIAAAAAGDAERAEQQALEAYFRHFEGAHLETAVMLFRGSQQAFALERAFARFWRAAGEAARLPEAEGRRKIAELRNQARWLAAELRKECQHLEQRQVDGPHKVAALLQGNVPNSVGAPGTAVPVHRVLRDLRSALEQVGERYGVGRAPEAASMLAAAYFDLFHQIEPALRASAPNKVLQLEEQFLQLRHKLAAGHLTPEEGRAELGKLYAAVENAAADLRSGQLQILVLAANSFLILFREGLEAILMISALVGYLVRTGQQSRVKFLASGVVAAVGATVLCWAAVRWLLSRSGLAQELLEGLVALTAAAVLFYVSYWLISKTQARRWQEFLSRRVHASLTTGKGSLLALAAFLAVYREGAETMLFYEALLIGADRRTVLGALAGASLAVAGLLLMWQAMRTATSRLPLRGLFQVTGTLLFVLAIVFAGQGTRALQEAGLMDTTPLLARAYAWLSEHAAPLSQVLASLGIYPTLQTLSIQLLLLVGGLGALAITRTWKGKQQVQPAPAESRS